MVHALKLSLIHKPAQVILVVLALVSLLVSSLGLAPAQAQSNKEEACRGVGLATGGNNCDDAGDAEDTIGNIVSEIIRILIIVTGAAAVVMFVVGGFRYIISAGDSNAAAAAKKTIIYALVGLVIVIFAQVIVSLVANTADEAATGTGGGGGTNSGGTPE